MFHAHVGFSRSMHERNKCKYRAMGRRSRNDPSGSETWRNWGLLLSCDACRDHAHILVQSLHSMGTDHLSGILRV